MINTWLAPGTGLTLGPGLLPLPLLALVVTLLLVLLPLLPPLVLVLIFVVVMADVNAMVLLPQKSHVCDDRKDKPTSSHHNNVTPKRGYLPES